MLVSDQTFTKEETEMRKLFKILFTLFGFFALKPEK